MNAVGESFSARQGLGGFGETALPGHYLVGRACSPSAAFHSGIQHERQRP